MSKYFIKRLCCLLTAAGLAMAAPGSGMQKETGVPSLFRDAGVPRAVCAERPSEPEQVSEGQDSASMGSVAPFRDDAGKNIQMAEGQLYTYWDNCLSRYDPVTLEETVLYQAASSQRGDFCIWGDYIYFMVVPNVSSIGKVHGYLYRVKRDGSQEAVCLSSVKMPGQGDRAGYYRYYTLDTYEDILYLIGQEDDTENLYFCLDREGNISRAPESDTLYGKLPEGYSGWRAGDHTMSLPYAMRNYGYFFVMKEDGRLVRMEPESLETEAFTALDDSVAAPVFTNDAILCRKGLVGDDSYTWYRIPLDNIEETEMIGQGPAGERFVFCHDDGVYIVSESYEGPASLVFLDREGKTETQKIFPRTVYSNINYFDGTNYYYTVAVNGEEVVKRLGTDADSEPEKVADYVKDSYGAITVKENIAYSWTDVRTGNWVEHEITEVRFTEETAGFARINAFLEELYAQQSASAEEYKDIIRQEDYEREEEAEGPINSVELSENVNVCYMDENYVGICLNWYVYFWGAVHGMHGSVYYMFDRETGNRVFITDVVKNTPEEICELTAPYVEAVAAWETDEEKWEEMLLEEGRFFLSEEGIGIHFDVYELDCYAAGEKEVIVPYSMFDLY